MRTTVRSLGAAILTAALACAAAAGPPGFSVERSEESIEEIGARAVKVRLIAERAGLTPGETGLIGVSFDIDPGWHLYWHNPGDTGMPMRWTIDAPPQISLGEPQWPAPHRHVLPGGILDYIYEDQVTIIIPVTLSADATPGEKIRITGRADWLVCREACVPGSGTFSLELMVGTDAPRSPHAARFDTARERLAATLKDFQEAGGGATWDGTTLVIRAPVATTLEFFPCADDRAALEDAIRDGSAPGGELRLRYKARVVEAEQVRGVVAATWEGRRGYYLIEVPPPPR